MKHTPLSVPMTRNEQFWGFGFLMVQQFVLSRLVWLLPLGSPVLRNLLYAGISFGAAIGIFFRFWKESVTHFPGKIGIFLWKILLSCAAYTVFTELFGHLLHPLFPRWFSMTETGPALISPNEQAIRAMVKENFPLMALCTVVLIPPVEEILHRGVVFGALCEKHPVAAYLLSTGLFAAIHVVDDLGTADPIYLLLCFLQYLPAGFLLARLYRETDSIFAPILMHMAINAMALFDLR